MSQELRGRSEDAPESRIAGQVVRINHQVARIRGLPVNLPMLPDYADYRDGLRLYMRREILTALRNEAREIASVAAIRQSRVLYLENRELELQREIDEVNRQIMMLEQAS